MNELLGVDMRDNVDGGSERRVSVVPGVAKVVEARLEEGGFDVLEEVDCLEIFDCGLGDAFGCAAVGWTANCEFGCFIGRKVASDEGGEGESG